MVEHCLNLGYQVVGVCREQNIGKLDRFKDDITIIPGATNDADVIRRAVRECDGVLTVLVPWGMQHYASGTAQAVLDYAPEDARLIFSCGWHISRDGLDVYPLSLRVLVSAFSFLGRLFRVVDINDQVEACQRIFTSSCLWTVVRCSDMEEGPSQGIPVWSHHVGDSVLKSNLTRRVDFALFMVRALTNPGLIHESPAIVGCQTESALAYAAGKQNNTR